MSKAKKLLDRMDISEAKLDKSVITLIEDEVDTIKRMV